MPSNAEYMLTEIWEACKHTAPGSPTLGLCLPSERPTSGLASEGKSLEGTQSEQSRAPRHGSHISPPSQHREGDFIHRPRNKARRVRGTSDLFPDSQLSLETSHLITGVYISILPFSLCS